MDKVKKEEKVKIEEIEIQSEVKKDLEKRDLGTSLKWAKFNILPIFIFIFFVAMSIFFTIPQFKSLFSNLDEIKSTKAQIGERDQTIDVLTGLRNQQSESTQLIQVMNDVVPSESTRVVNYKEELTNIATNVGLEVSSSSAGENIRRVDINQSKVEDINELHLIVIPILLEASGSIDEFEKFLTELYDSYDFFVVEEMDISKKNETEWSSTFRIVKYQFGGRVGAFENNPDTYVNISNSTPSEEVTKFIQEKFSKRNTP